ncbi:MAG TPA: hypothetical protein VGM54_14715 [Chthoniobacter sp.]|jgi:hypothetical protein
MSTPLRDDDQSLRDALQHDAARISKRPFDAALHQATMRRIRALGATESKTPWFVSWPALATAAAVAAMIIAVALWPSRPSSRPVPTAAIAVVVSPVSPRASLLSYQIAANEGDAALFARLDHDAADLLPASSPVFNAPQ